jgi:hypothetical protein
MPKTQAHRAPAVVPRHASDQLRKAGEPAPKLPTADKPKPAKPVDNKETS